MDTDWNDQVHGLRDQLGQAFELERRALGMAWRMRTVSLTVRRQVDDVCARAYADRRADWKRLLLAAKADAILRGQEPTEMVEAERVGMLIEQMLAAWEIMAQTQEWLIATYNNVPTCRPGIEQAFAQLKEYMEKMWKMLQMQKMLNVGSDQRELLEPIRVLTATPIVPRAVRPSISPDSPVLDRPWTDREVASLVAALNDPITQKTLAADADDGPPGPRVARDSCGNEYFVNPLVRLYRDGRLLRVWYPPAIRWQEGFLRDAVLCRLAERKAMTTRDIEACVAEIGAHVPQSAAATSDQYARELIERLTDGRYMKEQVTKKYGHRYVPLGRGKSTARLVMLRWAKAMARTV